MDWATAPARRDRNQLSFVIWCALYQRFYSHFSPHHVIIGSYLHSLEIVLFFSDRKEPGSFAKGRIYRPTSKIAETVLSSKKDRDDQPRPDKPVSVSVCKTTILAD